MGALILWLLTAAWAAPECELEAPADAPFEVRAPAGADHVHVIVEVWSDGRSADWARELLGVLSERNMTGVLVVPVREALDPALETLLNELQDQPHEVAVRLSSRQIPRDATLGPRELRGSVRPYRKAAKSLKTAVTPIPNRIGEAIVGRAGFRTILLHDGPSTATPRPAVVFEGQPRIGVVLPSGPYAGLCGTSAVAATWTPKAADRATQAIHGAARAAGMGVVRVALTDASKQATDAALLARWLDEVVVPAAVRVEPPSAVRSQAMQFLRTGKPDEVDPSRTAGGRLLNVDDVMKAAEALVDVRTVPRELPGDTVPTEAFLAFAKLLLDDTEGQVVRLQALQGPADSAATGLTGEIEIPRDQVVGSAEALMASLPSEIPAAMPVGGHLLTAGELLLLYASAVRGEEPPKTRPVAVSEPNQKGLGFGASSVP